MQKFYYVYTVDENNNSQLLYKTFDEEQAQDEVDRINSFCANTGRPATAYYI